MIEDSPFHLFGDALHCRFGQDELAAVVSAFFHSFCETEGSFVLPQVHPLAIDLIKIQVLQYLLFRDKIAPRRVKSCKRIVVALRPFVIGMVVALRAADLGAKEKRACRLHPGEAVLGIAEIIASLRLLPCPPFGDEHFAHKLIVWFVLVEASFQPDQVIIRLETVVRPALGTEGIAPIVISLADISLARKEAVDQIGTLAG